VQATLQFRRELLDLDVDAIEVPEAGEPPPGTRAADVAALGALVVHVADPQLLAAIADRPSDPEPDHPGRAAAREEFTEVLGTALFDAARMPRLNP
jgi:hypothetical protein